MNLIRPDLTKIANAVCVFLSVSFLWAQGAAPDLSITKSHNSNFVVGQQGSYIILVRNVGTGPTTGQISVADQLPPGMTAVSIDGDGWNCRQPSGPCQRADVIGPRESYSPITLIVNATAAGTVVNEATVSGGGDNNTGNDVAHDPTVITVLLPDLRISKQHAGDFTPGQNGATYTITVDNIGPGTTSAPVTVTDTLPSGLTAVSITGAGWSCTQPSGPCNRADALLAGGSYPPITLSVNVAPTAAGILTNVATVKTTGDTNSNNDTANDPTTIVSFGSDLRIRKTHQGDFTLGQTGTYTLLIDNLGQGATNGRVTVSDTAPAGLSITSMGGDGWACSTISGPCLRDDALPVGAAYPPITVTVSVAQNAPANVINVANVSGGGDTNGANNMASDPTNIINPFGCTIESAHPYANNFDFTWTCVVPGNPAASNVQFDNQVFLDVGDLLYIMDGANNNIQGSPFSGDALSGQNKIVLGNTVKLRLVTDAAGTAYGFKANIFAGSPSASQVDLTLIKSHTGDFYQAQVGAQYTITVRNVGSTSSSGVVTVSDVIPSGMTATNITGPGWNCNQSTLSCTRSDALAPAGQYPPLTLTVNLAENAPAALANTATVSGGGDNAPANNVVSDATNVRVPQANCTGPGGPLPLGTLPESAHPYGDNLRQVWTCVQQGNPAGIAVSFDSLSSFFGAGDTLEIQDKFGNSVPGSPFSGDSLMNRTINVVGDTATLIFTTDSRRNAYGFKVIAIASRVTGAPDLTLTKSHIGSFSQGQSGATYTIVVRNIGGAPSQGLVTVADVVPAGLVAKGFAGTGWNCAQPSGPCTRSDAVPSGGAYPELTLTVDVLANAPASVTNTASVAGGGDTNPGNNNAGDPTTIVPVAPANCDALESQHPYSNNVDQTYSCTLPGNVGSVRLTFDSQTSLGLITDAIFITDGNGVNIAGSPFTGQSLAGQTVTVPGNTVRIRLVTDDRRVDYGFRVTNIVTVPAP